MISHPPASRGRFIGVSLVLALCVLEVSAGQSTGNWLKSINPTLAQYESVFEGNDLGTTAALAALSDADLQQAFVSMKIKKPHRRVIANAIKTIPAEAASTSEDQAPAETKPKPKKETKTKVDKVVAQTTTAANSKDLDFAAGGEAMMNYHDPLVRRVAADTAVLPKRTFAFTSNSYQGFRVPDQQGYECERIEMPEPEVFYKEYILKRKPVVIVAPPDDDSFGYLGWKTHKWLDFGYLKEKAGDVEVQLEVRPTAAQLSKNLQELVSIDTSTGKKRARKKRKSSADDPPATPEELATEDKVRLASRQSVFKEKVMPFSAFLDNIHAKNKSTALEHYYLNQQTYDAKYFPYSPILRALHNAGEGDSDKQGDMPVPNVIKGFRLKEFNMWLGSAPGEKGSLTSANSNAHAMVDVANRSRILGSTSRMHFDSTDNLYALLEGQKKFTMYGPADAERCYVRAHIDAVDPAGRFTMTNPINMVSGVAWMTPPSFSKVSPTKDNYWSDASSSSEAFPLLRDAHPATCIVNKGEMLYMPANWFHEVTSVGSPHMAINLWFHPSRPKPTPAPANTSASDTATGGGEGQIAVDAEEEKAKKKKGNRDKNGKLIPKKPMGKKLRRLLGKGKKPTLLERQMTALEAEAIRLLYGVRVDSVQESKGGIINWTAVDEPRLVYSDGTAFDPLDDPALVSSGLLVQQVSLVGS
jgi:hypothetical protein